MFLVAWACRNRISATAMNQLLEALRRFFGMQTSAADATTVTHPAEWPKKISNASTSQGHVIGFDNFLLCPKEGCGACLDPTYIAKLAPNKKALGDSLCPRPVSLPTEAPPPEAPLADPTPCGHRLFKTGRAASKQKTTPHHAYPLAGLKQGLERLLLMPKIEELCETWRSKYTAEGKRQEWKDVHYDEHGWPEPVRDDNENDISPVMSDIMDGRLWEEAQYL